MEPGEHYNGHRPHRALNLTPPDRTAGTLRALNASPLQKLRRTDRLGGLIHEYSLAACGSGFAHPTGSRSWSR